jgi:hypothetical protein
LSRLIFTSVVFLFYFFLCIKTKKPFHYSVLFLIFLLPFNITLQQPNFSVYIQGFSSNYVIPTLSIIDVFVFFTLVFSFKGKKLSKNTKLFFVIFFLFLTAKAFLDNTLLSTLLIYRVFFYALATIYIVQFFPFKKNLKAISRILLVVVAIQLIIGIIQFNTGHSLGLHFLGESNLVKGMFGTSFINLNDILYLRAYGTFPHPNVLAGFLLGVLFFSIANLKKERINVATSILATNLIFLTFSRIVILLTILLWIGFFFFKITKKNKKTNLFTIYPLFFTRFLNLFLENDGSFSDRVELLKTSREILKNYPYIGIGVGKFVQGIDYYPVYTAGGFLLLQPVHNVFLLILSEYGLVFGIPLVFLILTILTKAFLKGSFLIKFGVFSILTIAMFDHYLVTLPQGLFLFTFILVFLANLSQKHQKRLNIHQP